MEISQLRYFVEICRVGSMVAAAENMHITQQGISIAIRRLETELNHDLFYQKNRKLCLTKFGTEFRVHAERVIDQMDELLHFLESGAQSEKTVITVAISRHVLAKQPPALQQLLITPPEDFLVNLVETYSVDGAEMVLNGTADFALVYDEYDNTLYDQTQLYIIRQGFIVNRKNPLAERDSIRITDLDNVPLLIPDLKTRPGKQVESLFENAGCRLRIAYLTNLPHQAVEMVADNPALVARSVLSYLSEFDKKIVKPLTLEDTDFSMPFTMLVKKGRKLTVHQQLFQHLILDCYQDWTP